MIEIVETVLTDDEHGFETDVKVVVDVIHNGDTVKSVEIGEGEPEDMTLGRDLSDAYRIADLLVSVADMAQSHDEPIEKSSRVIRKKEYYGF